MQTITQSPTDSKFVQNPYPFYEECLGIARPVFWQDYDLPAVFDYATVGKLLKDKRLGREAPADQRPTIPARLQPFYDVEAHSMLELEPPRHTRLRGLVLRAFTTRRIAGLGPEIAGICNRLIDQFPDTAFDLLPHFATQIPVIIIARLLGVPESMAPKLLEWSNAMVMMYQARRTPELEHRAVIATQEFAEFMRGYIDEKRTSPADDLISHLIAAEQDGDKLTSDELITTCILLLNAGHEATVHTLGNGIKTLLEHGANPAWFSPDAIDKTVEEILRFDPPLHMFTRFVYDDVYVAGQVLPKGSQVALMYGATGRDPNRWDRPNQFDPTRAIQKNLAFGGGIHFCVGAPLARLEMQIALPILFKRCPTLMLATPPQYANIYHFHGLSSLMVQL